MSFNFKDNIPIYLQIMDDIKYQLVSGKLKQGDQVDSVRNLAVYYGANPNTIQKSLMELERENLMKSERTSGRFICASEESIKNIKNKMAESITSTYLEDMKKIGYSKSAVISYIDEIKGE